MTFATKPVKRETAARSRRQPLVAILTAHSLFLYEKGRPSTKVEIPHETAYDLGWRLVVRQRKAEKAATKKGK